MLPNIDQCSLPIIDVNGCFVCVCVRALCATKVAKRMFAREKNPMGIHQSCLHLMPTEQLKRVDTFMFAVCKLCDNFASVFLLARGICVGVGGFCVAGYYSGRTVVCRRCGSHHIL